MKTFCLGLIFISLIVNTFAQPPLEILYLGASGSKENSDTILVKLLEDMGHNISYMALGAESPLEGFDVAVFSGTISAGNAYWSRYTSAPMPMLLFKPIAVKTDALNWGNTETEYNLSSISDSLVTVVDQNHPILKDIENQTELKIFENAFGSAMLDWVYFPPVSGYTIVAFSGVTHAKQHAIVAIDCGTQMNENATLLNNAAILGFHSESWNHLSDAGKHIINNSLNWNASGWCSDLVQLPDNSAFRTIVAPNPSQGYIYVSAISDFTNYTIKLYSSDGRNLYTRQVLSPAPIQIDLSSLQKGMYILQFQIADSFETHKLIKN